MIHQHAPTTWLDLAQELAASQGGEPPTLLLLSVGNRRAEIVGLLVGHRLEDVERELILQTLERCNGNRTSASAMLGISVRTMRNKLRRFLDAGFPVAPAL